METNEAEWVALLRSIGAGDQDALRSLFDRTHRLVHLLALRITSNRETAEEVTLDVFHDVWRRAASFEPANGHVLGWILLVARSRAIDRLRFEQRRKRVADGAPPAESERARIEPSQPAQIEDRRRLLHGALARLTSDERQAIEIAYFHGASYVATALRLGESEGTVKSRIRSGLEKLRRALRALEDET